jgi:hypothetical protein
MVATSFETHHHYHHQSEPKMNDIFEQTVTVDKPLSTHFYDNLKEVTIDAEIIVGRKGIVEEIVPLEQWATVISETFTEIPEEDWVIEPEEVVYTVVKWEGIEGGEKHIIENKKWVEVAHTPPIHTRHHISPLTGLDTEHHENNFSFSKEDIHNKKTHAHGTNSSESSNKIHFEKPHVSEIAERTWHTSHNQNITATHEASEISNGGMDGYGYKVAQNDEPLGAWHKVQSPTEDHVTHNSSTTGSYQIEEKRSNSPTTGSYQIEEQRSTWHKTHANDSSENSNRIIFEKPHVSATTETTWRTGQQHNVTATHQTYEISNGGMNGYDHTAKHNGVHHQFIAAKPACHSTFMSAYEHKIKQNDEVHSPTENNVAHNTSTADSYQNEEQRGTFQKTDVDQTSRPNYLHKNEENFTPIPATRIPKPRTSPSAYSKLISPESPNNGEARMTSQKVTLKSNGNTVFRGGYSPQPSPPAVQHHFISAAKPACHSTFMTSYTSNSPVLSPEQAKSPPRTPGGPVKVTWRRTHGNQYVRETVSTNNSK